jgi:uncharacterized protein YbdZ (MbtH family)
MYLAIIGQFIQINNGWKQKNNASRKPGIADYLPKNRLKIRPTHLTVGRSSVEKILKVM